MKCSILSAACCALVGRCHCAACCGGLSVTRFHFSIPSCGQFRYDLWSFTTDGFYRNNWGFRYVCWVETKVGASCVWPARSEHFRKNWWVLTLSAGKNFSHLRNHFRVQDPSKKHNTSNSHLPEYILLDTSTNSHPEYILLDTSTNSHLPKYILLDTSLLIWSNLVPRTKSLPHLLQSWCSRSKSGGILSTLEAGFDRCADHKSIAENQLPCLSNLKSFTCRSGDQGHGVLV